MILWLWEFLHDVSFVCQEDVGVVAKVAGSAGKRRAIVARLHRGAVKVGFDSGSQVSISFYSIFGRAGFNLLIAIFFGTRFARENEIV